MALSVLTDRRKQPDTADLAAVLGKSKVLWDALKKHVREIEPDIVEDWKHYGKNSGWTMKLLRKKRNLFFSYPGNNEFHVVFVFGDRAVAEVEKSKLPRDVIDSLVQARKYAEGRGLKLLVSRAEDLDVVRKLLAIKLAF